jgi:hypothetical protein
MTPLEQRAFPLPDGVRMRLNSLALCIALLGAASCAQGASVAYVADPEWLKLPEGRTEIGSMHGDIAVSAAGEVYISVEGTVKQRFAILGPNPGLQVYSREGKYLRNVPDAPFDLHGFLIRQEPAGEFLYAVRLAGGMTAEDQTRAGVDKQVIVKMTLDGKIVMSIPASSIPDEFKSKSRDGRAGMRLTGIAVAPNGDIYVSDGYASDYLHRFDRNGKYISSFGGKQPPYSFNQLHKIVMDTRFEPARLIGTDRQNARLVQFALDGTLAGVVATDLKRPGSLAIRGDYLAVGELAGGRIDILDKKGTIVTQVGVNAVAEGVGVNTTPPDKWRPGEVTAPHGLAFTPEGDLLASEFNLFGRVHRFVLQP